MGTTLSPLWSVLLISCFFYFLHIFLSVFLSFHTSVNAFTFLAKCLITLSKLWCVTKQLSENRSHKCLPNFLLYFFRHTGWNTLARLIISLRGNQPATHDMLQKEIINGFRKPAWQNTKLLLKMIISDLRDTWSNTTLTEFG